MNKFLVALVLVGASLSASAARADTLLIEGHSDLVSFGGAAFRFNAQEGTAWMVVNLFEDIADPATDVPFHGPLVHHWSAAVSVEGLSYDAAAAQVVFTGQVGKVVCGTVVEKKGLFGMKQVINLTGACRTYSVREHRGENVYFEAK
jgi:hypothetical protein